MYESPITMISNGIRLSLEDEVYKVVEQIGIEVDKNELVKALNYDREQYEKGYADAKAEQKKGKWIVNEDDDVISGTCSCCGWNAILLETYVIEMPFCPNCGAKMEVEKC